MIENINYADMEQALTNLASKNDLVIGVGGQTQAAVLKVAKRFPKKKFSIVGGNQGESAANVAGYDVKQAQIAYVAGAAAAMLGRGGKSAVAAASGMSRNTVIKAEAEVAAGIEPAGRLRAPGGWRQAADRQAAGPARGARRAGAPRHPR
jgi:basic membrane protein A